MKSGRRDPVPLNMIKFIETRISSAGIKGVENLAVHIFFGVRKWTLLL
jgi:hypothetical protein